jgi:hypothetical protein
LVSSLPSHEQRRLSPLVRLVEGTVHTSKRTPAGIPRISEHTFENGPLYRHRLAVSHSHFALLRLHRSLHDRRP